MTLILHAINSSKKGMKIKPIFSFMKSISLSEQMSEPLAVTRKQKITHKLQSLKKE